LWSSSGGVLSWVVHTALDDGSSESGILWNANKHATFLRLGDGPVVFVTSHRCLPYIQIIGPVYV
jgi:hypothetical protein